MDELDVPSERRRQSNPPASDLPTPSLGVDNGAIADVQGYLFDSPEFSRFLDVLYESI